MLPFVDALFTLVRQLAHRLPVTEVAAPKWLVQRHGLAPLVARCGERSFREALIRGTLDWAAIAKDLPLVVGRLRDNGIRVAPIKGVDYAKRLYAVPAERPMADIDLLVPPDHRRRARQTLVELGFEPGWSPILHHAEAWVRGDLVIDLHWSIIAPGRGRIDLAAVWSRMRPGWPEGAEALADSDALLFHLINCARNRLCVPLVHVVDAARLQARVDDKGAVMTTARAWHLERSIDLALRFCEAVLGDGDTMLGGLGPTREDVVELRAPSAMRKVKFDIATAGSPMQLVARAVGFGANQLRELTRRPKRVT